MELFGLSTGTFYHTLVKKSFDRSPKKYHALIIDSGFSFLLEQGRWQGEAAIAERGKVYSDISFC